MFHLLALVWYAGTSFIATGQLFTMSNLSNGAAPASFYCVKFDETGSFVYLGGSITSALDGQPYSGGKDAVLVKAYLNGSRLWTRMFGDSNDQFLTSVSVNKDTGDVYVAGLTNGPFNGQTYGSYSNNLFLMRIASNGSTVLTKIFGSTSYASPINGFLETSRILICGTLQGFAAVSSHSLINGSMLIDTMITSFPGRVLAIAPTGTTNSYLMVGFYQSTNYGQDAFVSKYNLDGTQFWNSFLRTTGDDYVSDIQLDQNTQTYFATSSINGQAYFFAILESGTFLFSGPIYGTAGRGVAIHGPTSRVYVTGQNLVSATSSTGFVAAYSEDGTLLQLVKGSTGTNTHFNQLAFSLDGSLGVMADRYGSFAVISISLPFVTPIFTTQLLTSTSPTTPSTMVTVLTSTLPISVTKSNTATPMRISTAVASVYPTIRAISATGAPTQDQTLEVISATLQTASIVPADIQTLPTSTAFVWKITNVIILAAIAAGFLVALLIITAICLRCRKRSKLRLGEGNTSRQNLLLDPTDIMLRSSTTQSDSGIATTIMLEKFNITRMSTSTAMGATTDTTWNQTQTFHTETDKALSVPGFMQVKPGVDFSTGQPLAKGGVASILLATPLSKALKERSLGRPIVAKVLTVTERELEGVDVSFQQEVAMMYFFVGIETFAQMLGYSTNPNMLIMRQYTLGSLKELIHSKVARISTGQTVSFVKDIANSLKIMHENGFAHCDIKPENVLLDQVRGKIICVLTDFGISKIFDGRRCLVKAFDKAKIEGASLIYAAPEVLTYLKTSSYVYSQPEDPLTMKHRDTYALAVVILELLTRRTPKMSLHRQPLQK